MAPLFNHHHIPRSQGRALARETYEHTLAPVTTGTLSKECGWSPKNSFCVLIDSKQILDLCHSSGFLLAEVIEAFVRDTILAETVLSYGTIVPCLC